MTVNEIDGTLDLRRSLRDLVALSMLPTVWARYDALQICADLVDVVSRMVDADGVYLSSPTNKCPDLLRLRNEGDREIERSLRSTGGEPPEGIQVLSSPLSFQTSDYFVVASRRPDFPNEMERLIVRVAVNQASTWLEWKRAEEAVETAERTARFLAEAGEILNRSLDYEETLRAISTLVVPRFADWCFVDLVEADGGIRRIAVAHPGQPEDEALATRLRRTYAPKGTIYGVSATFARGETTIMNDVSDDVLKAVARDEDHRNALLSLGIRCFVSVPLTHRGTTFGVISFLRTGSRTCFEANDVAMAEELARRAALAVDNARLYRNAQEANRAKDEFLANLSHELRTPMTAILGWAHLLQIGDLEPDQVAVGLQTIRQSGEAQAKLIDDLLDVSRIVTGKLHLNPVAVDLAAILQNAVAAIRPAAEAKRHHLEVDFHTGAATVLGDASRLQQVFWNLLSNAVKFTPPGGVVRLCLEETGVNLVVTVEDSGEGIGEEFLPLVFERFRQVATDVRGRTGLGLGLAIAKELVELHGGSITASSAGAGSGSTFTVSLPRHHDDRKTPDRHDRHKDHHHRLRSLRVLLVEDDETTRTLLATVLTNFGAEVTDAASVTDAEAALTTFDPQILITDIEMPGNDGISLLHLLRAKRSTLPAIAVSGHADDSSRARVIAAGFNGFVAKPLDPMLLADEILRALGHQ